MKYSELVVVFDQLESTSKRLAKTHYIADLLKKTPTEDLPMIVYMLQGRLFPPTDERTLGVADKTAKKAIEIATGLPEKRVVSEWKKLGDLGKVAEVLIKEKKQRTLLSHTLTVKKVFENLRKLVEITGGGSVDRKLKLVAELLTSAKPAEAKYVIKTALEQLRFGVGEGVIRDAIVWAYFGKEIDLKYDEKKHDISYNDKYKSYVKAVESTYDLTNDYAAVAKTAKEKGLKGLEKTDITLGQPIRAMLAMKEDTIPDCFKRVGTPAAIEYKYDGFRMIINKDGRDVKIFTRRLDNVTKQFPEVVKAIREHVSARQCILDAEAVGFDPKTKEYKPFQNISQRIKRKYDIEMLAKKLPVELHIFDIVYHNGKNLLDAPFKKRRDILDKIVSNKKWSIQLAKQIVTSDEKKAAEFYQEALDLGHEGVMFKSLDGAYQPGSRVGNMIKFKPIMEPLDLVIVAAEWGTGKRSGWLTSYVLACRDPKSGKFMTVGKASTGLKEKEEQGLSFKDLTKVLKSLIKAEHGRKVELHPQIVIEIAFSEIQKSPTYESGYALRFPRVVRIREDRGPHECATLADVKRMYDKQKKTGK
ncbi:ATP-dependent DNA ligase [Candidatus Woesearchaeota archaeon]|nr:ATP-dependent DNA ligase [Candidatus Woesearchaeota archaeon]